jgi:hypothetical protein
MTLGNGLVGNTSYNMRRQSERPRLGTKANAATGYSRFCSCAVLPGPTGFSPFQSPRPDQ